MDRREREGGVRMLLSGMSRRPVYKLAGRIEAVAHADILKDELIDLLVDVSLAALCAPRDPAAPRSSRRYILRGQPYCGRRTE